MQRESSTGSSSVMDMADVQKAYRRWAPVYDYTFGKVAEAGRTHAVEIINQRRGSLLEVGVGTGLSLPQFGRHLRITGIDVSAEMLEKAHERVGEKGLDNVESLREMDAGSLEFPDGQFDTVVAMYVLTVVPDPEQVMRELERVCAPGGEVFLINHFSQEEGPRGWIEQRMAPLGRTLGWRPVFPMDRVMVCGGLELAETRSLRPFGLFTLVRFVKEPAMTAREADRKTAGGARYGTARAS